MRSVVDLLPGHKYPKEALHPRQWCCGSFEVQEVWPRGGITIPKYGICLGVCYHKPGTTVPRLMALCALLTGTSYRNPVF